MRRVQQLITRYPWLSKDELELCFVGSVALYEACLRNGLPLPPEPRDLDLAWKLDPAAGRSFLGSLGISAEGSRGTEARGTIGAKLGEQWVEFTTYRAGGGDLDSRIAKDASLRDMTIGAVFWRLSDNEILDPMNGVGDWKRGVINACGLPEERIREHPVRALRYLRKAVSLGFYLDPGTRRAIRSNAAEIAAGVLPEALSQELRRVLASCSSPGVFFQMCHEEKLLVEILPEIAPVFDGRPAGRFRHHPEISQALHMILALSTATRIAERAGLAESERVRLLLCVLCHDLGKGLTPRGDLPSHPGHEAGGRDPIEKLFERVPGLGGRRTRRLCIACAKTHLLLGQLRSLKPGTLIDLYDSTLVDLRDDFRVLARVVRSDREGRLRPGVVGFPAAPQRAFEPDYEKLEERIHRQLAELDRIVRSVSGEESQQLFPGDPAALRAHLREARCRALKVSGFLDPSARRKG